MKSYVLYVLLLQNDNYYVGSSCEHEKRIENHFKGKGAAWTKAHLPIQVKEKILLGECAYREAEIAENTKTVGLMRKYGWQKVRGGFFPNVDEHNLLGSLASHTQEYNIDFIPPFVKNKKGKPVRPNELAIASSELSEPELKKRIQASVAAYFGNLYAHQTTEVLLSLDCESLYEDWFRRFQTRYGTIVINKEAILGTFVKLKRDRIKKNNKPVF